MMLDDQAMQVKMVETVYSLASNDRLSWDQKNKDSYSTKIDKVNIDIDKTSSGDQVTYVFWVFNSGSLVSRIDGRGLSGIYAADPTLSYHEILKRIFDYASKHVKARALERALSIVEAYRESNQVKLGSEQLESDF